MTTSSAAKYLDSDMVGQSFLRAVKTRLCLLACVAAVGGSCSRKTSSPSAALTSVCRAQTTSPGQVYAQDFEQPCFDWFTRAGVPVTVQTDNTQEKDPAVGAK